MRVRTLTNSNNLKLQREAEKSGEGKWSPWETYPYQVVLVRMSKTIEPVVQVGKSEMARSLLIYHSSLRTSGSEAELFTTSFLNRRSSIHGDPF